MPPSDPYRAEHLRCVSSRPLPHRACSSPAHGVPPGSRRPAFRIAGTLASRPSDPSPRPRPDGPPRVGDRGPSSPLTLGRRSHTRLQGLRWGRLCCPCPSPLLLPAPTSAARSAVSWATLIGLASYRAPQAGRPAAVNAGAQTDLSCSVFGCANVPIPLRRRVPWGCISKIFTPSMAFAGWGAARLPLCSRQGGDDLRRGRIRSMLRTACWLDPKRVFVVTLQRSGSLLALATSYTAAWSLRRPDLHRQVEHSFQDAPPSSSSTTSSTRAPKINSSPPSRRRTSA